MKINIFYARERIGLSRIVSLVIIFALFISQNAWSQIAPVFGEELSLIGVILIGIAVIGRIWCGSFICGFKNTTLVMNGPYSACRNPLYFFSFIGALGIGLTTQTLTIPTVITIIFWIYYTPVMSTEEKKLMGIHGAEFEKYCARVPRFFPSFKNYTAPAEYTVSTKHFQVCLKEVVWFIIAAGIIDFIEELHILHYLPNKILIY